MIVACAAVLMRGTHKSHTVSHVARTIRDIALTGNDVNAPYGAGTIGPWKIAAEEVDLLTGEFVNFRLDSGPMLITAGRAALRIDPDTDTFSFEMWDVAFTRVPGAGDDDENDAFVHTLEHHVFGPAPYGMDIVRDGPFASPPPPPPESRESSLVDAAEG